MGWYCHISVQWGGDAWKASVLARDHLERLEAQQDADRHAKMFLSALGDGRVYVGEGAKGDVSFWGQVGNYVDLEQFVDDLRRFFYDMLQGEQDALDFYRVLVLYEAEQSGEAKAAEIYLKGVPGSDIFTTWLQVDYHRCPFSFGQS